MIHATADALHAIVSDAIRRSPATFTRAICPVCRTVGSVARAALDRADSKPAVYACRCDHCGAEWLDDSPKET